MIDQPTAIDLFCGAGGISLGLRSAGFDVRLAVDNDELAVRTYRENLGDHVLCESLSSDRLSAEGLLEKAGLARGECTLVAGGPPCQGFSVQRRGPDADPRNHLVVRFIEAVGSVLPRFFLMENVSGLMSKRGQPYLRAVRERAAEYGYATVIKKLNAADYGIPQNRKRAFLVGERLEAGSMRFRFPKPCGFPQTVGDAISDLPSPPEDGSPHPDVANHYREGKMSATNLERIRHIPPGGGREHLPEHLELPCHRDNPGHRHMDVYGRLAWDEPSVTLTARFDSFTRGRFGHPEEDRSITLREGARIQTFPDWFVFYGNREQCARQIGNAVPPRLAEVIGESFVDVLKGNSEERRDVGVQGALAFDHAPVLQ